MHGMSNFITPEKLKDCGNTQLHKGSQRFRQSLVGLKDLKGFPCVGLTGRKLYKGEVFNRETLSPHFEEQHRNSTIAQ